MVELHTEVKLEFKRQRPLMENIDSDEFLAIFVKLRYINYALSYLDA